MNLSTIINETWTCPDDGKVEELPLGPLVKVTGLLSYFLGRLGNFLLLGIVHYEKFGQDPQKRSLPDRLFTFSCLLLFFCSIIANTITIVRTFIGPVLNSIALFRYYLTSTLLAIPLAIAESIVFRCLMIFFFNDTAMVNDEFLATFLNLFNIMIGQMISIVRLNIGEFLYYEEFKFLSGNCIIPKYEKT